MLLKMGTQSYLIQTFHVPVLMLQLALSSMLLAQAIQLGSMVLIPMISILCNLIGLSWTTLICAALLVVSVLLVFCASVPEDEPGKALPGNVNGNGLFLAPMSMMSVYFASMKEHPKKKRNLITPMFVLVCTLNAVVRSFAITLETLFQVKLNCLRGLCDGMPFWQSCEILELPNS